MSHSTIYLSYFKGYVTVFGIFHSYTSTTTQNDLNEHLKIYRYEWNRKIAAYGNPEYENSYDLLCEKASTSKKE